MFLHPPPLLSVQRNVVFPGSYKCNKLQTMSICVIINIRYPCNVYLYTRFDIHVGESAFSTPVVGVLCHLVHGSY